MGFDVTVKGFGSFTATVNGDQAVLAASVMDASALLATMAAQGAKGDKGDTGATGAQGPQGNPGQDGAAATVTVGSTTTGAAGSSATVTNSGTTSAAVLNFTIPQGIQGDKGDTGDTGPQGPKGDTGDSGVAYATTPIQYDSLTKTVSIDPSYKPNPFDQSLNKEDSAQFQDITIKYGISSASIQINPGFGIKFIDGTYQTTAATSPDLTPYLLKSEAATTYYPLTNPAAYITSAALTGYATQSWVTSQGYITSSALTPYLLSSTASTTYQTQAGMSSYALLSGPTFSGVPKAPTAATSDNSTQIATTAFVKAQGYLTSAPVTSVAGKTGAVTLASTDITDFSTAVPAAVPSASTSTAGKVQLATNAELTAGSVTTKAITPNQSKALRISSTCSDIDLTPFSWLSTFSTWAGTRNRLLFPINGTTAAGSGVWAIEYQMANLGSANTGIDWTRYVTLSGRFWLQQVSPTTNNIFRFTLGKLLNNTTGDLISQGIGVRCLFGNALELQVHDGSTLTNVTSSFTPTIGSSSASFNFDVRVESDGSGNVTLYVNGTQVATTAAGPKTATISTRYQVNYELVSATTNTNAPQAQMGNARVEYGRIL